MASQHSFGKKYGVIMSNLPYYDRDGKQISNEEWMRLFTDKDYKIVKQTDIHGNKVSTVWLGTDHSFGDESEIVIFETMVFGDGMWDDYTRRWNTEKDALFGHSIICDLIAYSYMKKLGTTAWVMVRNPDADDEVHDTPDPSAVDHYIRRVRSRK